MNDDSHEQVRGNDADDPVEPSPVAPIGVPTRLASAALGILLVGAGTIAVFVSDNSIGTGVLLAAGAFFLLIGVTGHAVASAKLGDAEIRFRELARTVEATLESATDEVQAELAEALVESGPLSGPLEQRARLILAERDMIDAIDRTLRDDTTLEDHSWVYAGPRDLGADGYVTSPSGHNIAVVLKAAREPLRADRVTEIVHRLSDAASPILLISSSGFTVRARANADRLNAEGTRLAIVSWRSPEDDGELRRALRSLVALT